MNTLAALLWNRYAILGVSADVQWALSCHEAALHQAIAPTGVRIVAAKNIIRICAFNSDWQRAYEASAIAIPLIPKLASRSPGELYKKQMLSIVGFASNAAAMALQTDRRPLVALKFLEEGRGALATSLFELRTDIRDLQETQPILAEQFDRQEKLFVDLYNYTNDSAASQALVRRRKADQEMDNLIDKIRREPGCEDFLQAPSETALYAAASHGPIVVINVSEYRCDAIIIEQHQISSLALPNLNSKELRKKAKTSNFGSPKVLEWLWDLL